jgi:protein PhnA
MPPERWRFCLQISLFQFALNFYPMSSTPSLPACPQCGQENTYPDGDNLVCADCGFEWSAKDGQTTDDEAPAGDGVIRDANGNPLADGDAVILIKDLKVKGSSTVLKKGTKVKSIRLVDGDHEVDCKIEGASFMLKAAFLKKA